MQAVLFDIDGTLLHARGIGRDAFGDAFRKVYGKEYPDMAGVSFVGATDSGVLRMMCRQCGAENTPAKEEYFFFLLSTILDRLLAQNPPEVYPHVPAFLSELRSRNIILGLATGNVRATAWQKVRHAGLDGFFSFGGYGDESDDRAQIVRLAASRAPNSVVRWMAGDTPLDVSAAQKNGLRSLAVATGWVSLQELRDCGSDLAVPDFSDAKRIADIIEGM